MYRIEQKHLVTDDNIRADSDSQLRAAKLNNRVPCATAVDAADCMESWS